VWRIAGNRVTAMEAVADTAAVVAAFRPDAPDGADAAKAP
jgi:hypothetical protein